MSQLKRLAGDTAIYGVSSILGRSINYLLVILHTSVFFTEELGVFTGLYAYVAILNVVYTFGMETAFFRFINKPKGQEAYSLACTMVFIVSTLCSSLIIYFASEVALFINYPGTETLIIWLAIILWIDGILAIPFALIRQQNKARLFAFVKVGNILINVGLQLIFLLLIPYLAKQYAWAKELYDPSLGIGYIVLANLIANALFFPMLWNYLIRIRLKINWEQLKPMLVYSTPILIMGIAGMINEMLDKILLEQLLSDDFYENMTSTQAVGVYGQTFKLSIFMMLAIQAFRYAGEPFFFSHADNKNAPELFARVMHYFVIVSLLILVLVSINVGLIGHIFLRKSVFRVALYLVPILLLGKFFYGIYVNLNVWFKLTDKTRFGTYFSVLGAAITIIANILLIPVIGFLGSAIASVLCYLAMSIACYIKGRQHYPIPYKFGKLIPYVVAAAILVLAAFSFQHSNFYIDSAIRLVISLLVVIAVVRIEQPNLIKKA